jgi:hypothetical protein
MTDAWWREGNAATLRVDLAAGLRPGEEHEQRRCRRMDPQSCKGCTARAFEECVANAKGGAAR